MAIVLTKAALALKNAENNFQLVKFEAHKSKKKASNENELKQNEEDTRTVKSKKDLDLKKIRHEIVKFGMSGFDATKKEEAKIALAVSLGAKPPKREYLNYKELMEKRKKEKQKLQDDKNSMISKTVLHTVKKQKKKGVNNDVGHLLSSYGKVKKNDLKEKTMKKGGKRKRNNKLTN